MSFPQDHYPKVSPFKEEWLSKDDKKKFESKSPIGKTVYKIDWHKLYRLRKDKGLSYKELAALTGTDVSLQWVASKLGQMADEENESR